MATAVIVVTGRTFRPVDSDALSARRDDWIQARILDAGLDTLPTLLTQGENPAREVVRRALATGTKPLLLAGVLDEIGPDGTPVPWTPGRAAQLAEDFANVTGKRDRDALSSAFLGILVSFFANALGSSNSSASSGNVPGAASSDGLPLSPGSASATPPAPASPSSP